jgi:O2-independent ubiquinone biosynthesis protein UbiU
MSKKLELVCPAGNPAALHAAIDAGADCVYLGFRDETNARNFPGLNFSRAELRDGVRYAHGKAVKVLLAINTYPKAGNQFPWHQAIDDAADIKVDAVILADLGLLAYAKQNHPQLRRHLSVQASASNVESINFYVKTFDVKRVVLPRVLNLAEIRELNKNIDVETEVFAFGGLCVMAEGRCSLSSYITGISPNKEGVCSPASHVRYEERDGKLHSKLGEYTINAFPDNESAGYPTLCKGRFKTGGAISYLFEEPTSLNVLEILPDLSDAGVIALKIEGRQRGKAYVAQVVKVFRKAVDDAAKGHSIDRNLLNNLTEGGRDTAGAYEKKWG